MALKKIRLGELIEEYNAKNVDCRYSGNDVVGISTTKTLINTKANLDGVSMNSYKILPNKYFAYVSDTSRRGDKISLAYNERNKTVIVSSISTVFKVANSYSLLPDYLFMYFNRPEFDRYSRFNSWGSARENFSWEDFCDIEIDLPDLATQQKYVDIYNAMKENQKGYERGLEDLKLVCDGYIEKIKSECQIRLGNLLERRMEKNSDFKVEKLIGVGKNGFIEPKQHKDETNGHICYLIRKGDFVFAPPQIHSGSLDYYDGENVLKCSDAYIVFYIKDRTKLDATYLKTVLKNSNTQRRMWFFRDGVREQFNFEQLAEMDIPLPPIEVQESIANIYKCYEQRKEINEQLKEKIRDICPILIKGSIVEARGN